MILVDILNGLGLKKELKGLMSYFLKFRNTYYILLVS